MVRSALRLRGCICVSLVQVASLTKYFSCPLEPAVAALTQYYRKNIPRNSDILDICSSWVSHYPLEFKDTMKSIQGTGMNGLELQYNDQLSSYVQRDLNVEPSLPYPDNSMDVVTCVVSIDYLVQPITILKEVHRVLRPGGKVIISQSVRGG